MIAASTVVSAVAGRSERLKHRVYEATGLGEVFNDSNVHLSVKSSPEKTAPALSLLAEKEGPIVKLNDSGSWRRRRALLVPHTFLYYFGEHTADTDLRPHGVIDLQLYTDIQVISDNILKLAPGDESSPIRTFHLRLSDREEAEAWAQAIRETRFKVVREERDALRSAKTGLTDQLATHEEALCECLSSLRASRGRESAAVSELAQRNAQEARRCEQVRALLAASASVSADGGISSNIDVGSVSTGGERANNSTSSRSESDCARDYASSAPGGGTRLGVGGRGSPGAPTALSELAALEEVIAERARENASLKMANEALRKKEALADDRCRREVTEAFRLRDQERERAANEVALRSDLEAELQHLRAELADSKASRDEARGNLGVVAAACREAEAKARELQEHRRVLAREVKASRAEQKRLSAALRCATIAAAMAAATASGNAAAAATAAVAPAAPAAPAGNRDRSSSAASWAGGDGCGEVVVDPGHGKQEAGGGRCGGQDNGEEAAGQGVSAKEALSFPPHGGRTASEGEAHTMERAAETPDGDSVRGGGARLIAQPGGPASPTLTKALPGSTERDTASPRLRPSSSDVPGVLLQPHTAGKESTGGAESGGRSLGSESPVASDGTDCESDGVCAGCDVDSRSSRGGYGGSGLKSHENDGCSDSPTGGERLAADCCGDGRVAAPRNMSSDRGKRTNMDEKIESGEAREAVRGAHLWYCGQDSVQVGEGVLTPSSSSSSSSSLDTDPPGTPPGPEENTGRSGGASSPAATAAASAESLAAAFGESSSLRFNLMVQSLSAGLRETRKVRRTPLLGHLDNDFEDDPVDGDLSAVPSAAGLDQDDGGSTDGTGTEGGDSRDGSTTTTTSTRKDSGGSGVWSAWSTVGRSTESSHDGPPLLADDEEDQRRCRVSAAAAAAATDEICVRDGREGFVGVLDKAPPQATSSRTTRGAAAAGVPGGEAATPSRRPSSCSAKIAPTSTAAESASKKTAEWLRALGRPDGEEREGLGGQGDHDSPSLLFPRREESRGKGSDEVAASESAGSVGVVEANTDGVGDGGVGEAALAVALAAAERGGRLSAEAAVAARRWEAKVKGSFVSMASGVRWGMAPLQNDVKFFKC